MKKRLVKILTVVFCMVCMFTISASAYSTEQPSQDYLPFVMEDSQVILWQMMPYNSFAIDKSTFPEGQTPQDIASIVIAQIRSFTVLWAYNAQTGSYEGAIQIYGETYISDEPDGFTVKVYDWEELDNEYILNFGIYENASATWVYNPEDYKDIDNIGYDNAYYVPIAFYSNDTETADQPFNRELSYWAVMHYPMSNPYWEETDNPLYNIGYRDGKANAEKKMFEEGKTQGYNEARITEFNRGYNQGLQNADNATFKSLIFAVIDAPINVLTNMLEFDILGTNMASFFHSMISALMFLAIVKIIFRVLI